MASDKDTKKVNRKPVKPRLDLPQLELRFSGLAYARINAFAGLADGEVSMFGISKRDNPLYVEDIKLIKHKASAAEVDLDDDGIADYLEDNLDEGIEPCECFRIWIHTHPGFGTNPSGCDRDTFVRVWGDSDWAVMAIFDPKENTWSVHLATNTPFGRTITDYCRVVYETQLTYSELTWKDEFDKFVDQKEAFSYGTSLDCSTVDGIGETKLPGFYGGDDRDSQLDFGIESLDDDQIKYFESLQREFEENENSGWKEPDVISDGELQGFSIDHLADIINLLDFEEREALLERVTDWNYYDDDSGFLSKEERDQ